MGIPVDKDTVKSGWFNKSIIYKGRSSAKEVAYRLCVAKLENSYILGSSLAKTDDPIDHDDHCDRCSREKPGVADRYAQRG